MTTDIVTGANAADSPTDSAIGDVIYVVTDPGVPVFGRKGCSVHVQAVLRDLAARAAATGGRVTLIATRVGGEPPDGLESVEVVELPLPRQARAAGAAAREAALIEIDARAAELAADLVRKSFRGDAATSENDTVQGTFGSVRTRPAPLVYQRYSLFSSRVMEEAASAGARTVLEVNAPLVEEQATHRELHAAATAQEMTVRALRAAGAVIAVSRGVARWAEQESGRPVATVPNGVDITRYTPVAAREAERGVGPVVVFVGGFRPWHDPEQLVRAAAELDHRGIPVQLLLVGDGPCLPQVLDLAERENVRVRSVGMVAPEDVPGLLASADIAVAPYPAGGAYFSPLKVAEYLASGLPSVLSAVADLPDLLGPDEAHLVPPGDEAAFVEALGALACDVGVRARMGAAARAAAERFTWSAVVDRTLAAVPGVEGADGSVRAPRPHAGPTAQIAGVR